MKPRSRAGGGFGRLWPTGNPAAPLPAGEASAATTGKKYPWAVVGPGLALERQEVRHGAKRAPEVAGVEGSTGSRGHGLALRAAALAAQRFPRCPPEGGSAQPMGQRAGPVRRRRPALRPSPSLARPRAHTCEGHTKAQGSPRAAAQTKARPSPLPSSASPPAVRGCWAAWCLKTAHLLAPGPAGLAAPLPYAGGPPEHARAHGRLDSYTHAQVFLHRDPSTSHTRVYIQTPGNTPGAQALTTTNTTRVCPELSALSCGHMGTAIQVYPGIPPGHVCPRSYPCTLMQVSVSAFKSAFLPVHRPCAAQTLPGRQAHSMRMVVALTSAQRGQWPHQLHS